MQELVSTMRTNKAEEERLAATEAASATQSVESAVAAVAALADGDEADSGKETARAMLATALSTLATVRCPQGHAVQVYDGLPAARIQCTTCATALDKPAAELLTLLDRARTAVLEAYVALDHGATDKVCRLWCHRVSVKRLTILLMVLMLRECRRVAGYRPAQGCGQGGTAVAPAARSGAYLPADLAGLRGTGEMVRRRRRRQGRRATAGRGQSRLASVVRCVQQMHK